MTVRLNILCFVFLLPACSFADFSNDVSHIVNECLSCHHIEAVHGSLINFASRNQLSDEKMAELLLFIAAPTNKLRTLDGRSVTCGAIGALKLFPNSLIALPALETYISMRDYQLDALYTYGTLTQYDDRFLSVASQAVTNGTLDPLSLKIVLCNAIAYSNEGLYGIGALSRINMLRFFLLADNNSFDDAVFSDHYLSSNITMYSNSIEHVRLQEQMMIFLNNDRKRLIKTSAYRGEWNGGGVSDNEWYAMVTNACQTEIARVMALPENERLNMTAILDAKIAAIEEEEARAARRAIWKRRLSIGGVSLLTFVVVFAIARRIRQFRHTRVRRQ